jgi:hypothetical protein
MLIVIIVQLSSNKSDILEVKRKSTMIYKIKLLNMLTKNVLRQY